MHFLTTLILIDAKSIFPRVSKQRYFIIILDEHYDSKICITFAAEVCDLET